MSLLYEFHAGVYVIKCRHGWSVPAVPLTHFVCHADTLVVMKEFSIGVIVGNTYISNWLVLYCELQSTMAHWV